MREYGDQAHDTADNTAAANGGMRSVACRTRCASATPATIEPTARNASSQPVVSEEKPCSTSRMGKKDIASENGSAAT